MALASVSMSVAKFGCGRRFLSTKFIVRAAGTTVHPTDRGAAEASFVVRRSDSQAIEVYVAHGSVVLDPPAGFFDRTLGIDSSLESTLTAGDGATVSSGGVQFVKTGLEAIHHRLAWSATLLSFRGETLAVAVEKFNRYNQRRLIVADPSIASLRIGGTFQRTDPDSFVAALKRTYGIDAVSAGALGESGDLLLKASAGASER
jgi:ferric-dicitrate binding protein FerR (iron transport regulator)